MIIKNQNWYKWQKKTLRSEMRISPKTAKRDKIAIFKRKSTYARWKIDTSQWSNLKARRKPGPKEISKTANKCRKFAQPAAARVEGEEDRHPIPTQWDSKKIALDPCVLVKLQYFHERSEHTLDVGEGNIACGLWRSWASRHIRRGISLCQTSRRRLPDQAWSPCVALFWVTRPI